MQLRTGEKAPPLGIGLIGLDTSHVSAFASIFNDPAHVHHMPQGRVVAAYPGGTADWPLSADRVPGFTRELRDERGVTITESPEAVAEASDIVFITAVDGRVHRDLLSRVLPSGKPVFVDKPFAVNVQDAETMVAEAEQAEVPLMSCSALRYADAFTRAVGEIGGIDAVRGIDVFGPMDFQPALPGVFWYGCHTVEMIVASMGSDCRRVQAVVAQDAEIFHFEFGDGRTATYRGNRKHQGGFGGAIHGDNNARVFDVNESARPYYVTMLEAIMATLPNGRSSVPKDQMLACVSMMSAANRARETAGWVEI